jgi:hypothetical protein
MGKRNISLQIDEADVEAFDDFFSDRTEGRYSRSREIKRAMKLHHAVEKAIRDAPDLEFDSERSRRFWVRQAALDMARRDAPSPE